MWSSGDDPILCRSLKDIAKALGVFENIWLESGLIYASNIGVYVHEIGYLLDLDDRKKDSDGGGIMHPPKSYFIPPSDVWTIA